MSVASNSGVRSEVSGQPDLIRQTKCPLATRATGGRFLFGVRSALETLVRFAIVQQFADAVYGVLEDRGGGEHEHANRRIDERDHVEGGNKTGDLANEAEVLNGFFNLV